MTAIAPPPVAADTMIPPPIERAEALGRIERTRETPRSRSGSVLALLGFGAATLAAGALGGLVNRRWRSKLWYRTLLKPSYTPPDKAFAIVWPILYATAAVSAWRVWKAPPSRARARSLALWGAQIVFNAAWTPTFFGAHRPKAALGVLGGNAASLGAYAITARKVDPVASWLVAPYLGWLAFAGALNTSIVRKNRLRFRAL